MSIDYFEWTVAEIKEALEELGLPTSGKKIELIARLEDWEPMHETLLKIYAVIDEIENGPSSSRPNIHDENSFIAKVLAAKRRTAAADRAGVPRHRPYTGDFSSFTARVQEEE
jgi:hypothetical protein